MGEFNRELIHRLYVALDRRDGEAMAACYHPDATFRDPVFRLRGDECGDMWRMLTSRATDLRAEAHEVTADASAGAARWIARYTYSGTGRPVENHVAARFRFADGLVVEHVDTFDLWRWSRQALGPVGLVLGWSPLMQGKVRREAKRALDRFREKRLANRA